MLMMRQVMRLSCLLIHTAEASADLMHLAGAAHSSAAVGSSWEACRRRHLSQHLDLVEWY